MRSLRLSKNKKPIFLQTDFRSDSEHPSLSTEVNETDVVTIQEQLKQKWFVEYLLGLNVIDDENLKNEIEKKLFKGEPDIESDNQFDAKDSSKALIVLQLDRNVDDKGIITPGYFSFGPFYVNKSHLKGLFDEQPYNTQKLMQIINDIKIDRLKTRAYLDITRAAISKLEQQIRAYIKYLQSMVKMECLQHVKKTPIAAQIAKKLSLKVTFTELYEDAYHSMIDKDLFDDVVFILQRRNNSNDETAKSLIKLIASLPALIEELREIYESEKTYNTVFSFMQECEDESYNTASSLVEECNEGLSSFMQDCEESYNTASSYMQAAKRQIVNLLFSPADKKTVSQEVSVSRAVNKTSL